MLLPIDIPESERTPLVNWLLNLVAEQKQVIENQRQVIENQEETIADLQRKVERLEERVKGLDEELKAAKNQCRVPQTLIIEELRELGVDISAGQVNRILIENKEGCCEGPRKILCSMNTPVPILKNTN